MGYVYLINAWGTDRYKIGITKKNVQKRLKQLQTGCPDELVIIQEVECKNYRKVEGWMHRLHFAKRLEGEWFELLDSDVQLFTEECKKLDNTLQLLKEQNPFFD